jgi:hypothetical protein
LALLLDFDLFLLLVFLAVDLLLLLLVAILLFAFGFDRGLVAFLLVIGFASLLVVVIGPGGVVEGSVDSFDILI